VAIICIILSLFLGACSKSSEVVNIPDTKTILKKSIKIDAISYRVELVHDHNIDLNRLSELAMVAGVDIEITTDPQNGELHLISNKFQYRPRASFVGEDSFSYRLVNIDPENTVIEGDLEGVIDLSVVNIAPSTNSVEVFVRADSPNTIKFPLNDESDPNSLLTTTIISMPNNGTVEMLSPEYFRYFPNPGFLGRDGISFTVSDGKSSSSASIVFKVIGPSVDGSYDFFEVSAGSSIDIILGSQVGNKTKIDIVSSSPSGDLLSIEEDDGRSIGDYNYRPLGRFVGIDQFSYRVTNNQGVTSPLRLAYVNVVNTGPEYKQKALSTLSREDLNFVLDVTDQETNYEDLNFVITKMPENGRLTLTGDGIFTFSPEGNYTGYDFFRFKVDDGSWQTDEYEVPILIQNRAPVAQDISKTISSNSFDDAILLCSDPENTSMSYSIVDNPQRGLVRFKSLDNRLATFEAAPNDVGVVTYTYRCTDGELYSNVATVTYEITSVAPSIAINQLIEVPSNIDNEPFVFTLNYSDADSFPDDMKVFIVSPTTKGPLILTREGLGRYPFSTGVEISYLPEYQNSNYEDEFTLRLFDGHNTSDLVTIKLSIKNRKPISEDFAIELLSGSSKTFTIERSDPEETQTTVTIVSPPRLGDLTYNEITDSYTYYPSGPMIKTPVEPDSFDFMVSDSDGRESGPYTASVNILNRPPEILSDSVSTIGTVAVEKDIKKLDSDDLISQVAIEIVDEPQFGNVQISNNNSYVYTPTGKFNGTDSFTLKAIDPLGAESIELATIDITVNNHLPFFVDSSIEVMASNSIDVNLLDFVSDPDGVLPPQITPISQKEGNLIDLGASRVRYGATPGNTRRGELLVRAEDDKGASLYHTIPINITPAIEANEDIIDLKQGHEYFLSFAKMLENDSSLLTNPSPLSFSEILEVVGGEVTARPDGLQFKSLSYAGDPAYIKYRVSDSIGNFVDSIASFNIGSLDQKNALVFNNLLLFNNAKSTYSPPSVADIFNTWYRFELNSPLYTKDTVVGDATSWSYVGSDISSSVHSTNPIGFISSTIEQNYIHEVTLSSNGSDDDFVGVIATFKRSGGLNRYLSFERTQSCDVPNTFIYYFDGNTKIPLFQKFELPCSENALGGDGWSGKEVKVKIKRQLDTFLFEWSNIDSSNYEFSYSINLLDFPEMNSYLAGEGNYGYIVHSQDQSFWRDIKFDGEKTENKLFYNNSGSYIVEEYNNSLFVFETSCLDDLDCLLENLGGGNKFIAAPRYYFNRLTTESYWLNKSGQMISIADSCAGISLPSGVTCTSEGNNARLIFSPRDSVYSIDIPSHFTAGATALISGAGGGGYSDALHQSDGGSGETLSVEVNGIVGKHVKFYVGVGGSPSLKCLGFCYDFLDRFWGYENPTKPTIRNKTELSDELNYDNYEYRAPSGGGASAIVVDDNIVAISSGGGGGSMAYLDPVLGSVLVRGSKGAGPGGGFGADGNIRLNGQGLGGSSAGGSGVGVILNSVGNPGQDGAVEVLLKR
jgi:hypothetical protein